MIHMLLRTALILASITIILLGLIILPLPISLGELLIVIGATILIGSSETATELVKTRRARNPRLHNLLSSAEKRLPGKLGDVIPRTLPLCLAGRLPPAHRPTWLPRRGGLMSTRTIAVHAALFAAAIFLAAQTETGRFILYLLVTGGAG
jgi:hypothetical protein